ncbi:MAG: preprotein translocase subunit SecA [Sarcina sp.]
MVVNYGKKQLKKLEKLADEIIDLESKISKLTDENLKAKTTEFKKRLSRNETLDDILVEVFAVAREASYRVLEKKHYKVQLIGGIALHQGRVAQMKTGEGKTLTELCPAYLNALTEKGVHIITVNDYLAQRDKEEMEPFFNFLGIDVGLVKEKGFDKKAEYAKDITYTTNTELGFDYLRDNLAMSLEDKVQRELNYVIIDEIDSVLIDEARTPLIISGNTDEATDIYMQICTMLKTFNKDDYNLDEKENTIYITEKGIAKVEKIFMIENLADLEHTQINHIISQGLRAIYMLKKNKDYIVRNGDVVLIDSSTGRIAEGRRFSEGLHQCLEAKEGVSIKGENRTLATITYQNFFSLYKKVSGMSGTVKTEELEFREIYNLDVVCIPTNKEIKRIDCEDKIYIDNKAKLEAIIEDITKTHKKGNPILVGTPSIVKSEEISDVLKKRGIDHKLLNAKTNSLEAQIISKAGEKGAITVATNIAGRGTDIKISDEVEKLGGLKVIGTERTQSRRIDNQLIGRSGRQGSKGMSQFYLSCDDELLDIYGDGILKEKFEKALKKGKTLKSSYIAKAIQKAQNTIGSMNYQSRKYTLKYDFTLNKHRDLVYKDRDMVLGKANIASNISELILEEVFRICVEAYNKYVIDKEFKNITKRNVTACLIENIDIMDFENFFEDINLKVDEIFCGKIKLSEYKLVELNGFESLDEIIDYITNEIIIYLNTLLEDGVVLNDEKLRITMLYVVDMSWREHLDEMELLKKVVKDQSYNQKDPVEVYKLKSGEKFLELNEKIRSRFIANLFSSIFEVQDEKNILS